MANISSGKKSSIGKENLFNEVVKKFSKYKIREYSSLEYVLFPVFHSNDRNTLEEIFSLISTLSYEDLRILSSHINIADNVGNVYRLHKDKYPDLSWKSFVKYVKSDLNKISKEFIDISNWYSENGENLEIKDYELKAKYWKLYSDSVLLGGVKSNDAYKYWFKIMKNADNAYGKLAYMPGFGYERYIGKSIDRRDPMFNLRILIGSYDLSELGNLIDRNKLDLQIRNKAVYAYARRDYFLLGAGLHGESFVSAPSGSSYSIDLGNDGLYVIVNINENLSGRKKNMVNDVFSRVVSTSFKKELLELTNTHTLSSGGEIELIVHEITEGLIESIDGISDRLGNEYRRLVELAASLVGIKNLDEDLSNRKKTAYLYYILRCYLKGNNPIGKVLVYADGYKVFINLAIKKKVLQINSAGQINHIDWNLMEHFTKDLVKDLIYLLTLGEEKEVKSFIDFDSYTFDYTDKFSFDSN